MARIKYFRDSQIAIYIYGERYGKHHEKHVLVLKSDEDCQYGFDGLPVKNSTRLKNKSEHDMISEWIRCHGEELESAWEKINRGENPGMID